MRHTVRLDLELREAEHAEGSTRQRLRQGVHARGQARGQAKGPDERAGAGRAGAERGSVRERKTPEGLLDKGLGLERMGDQQGETMKRVDRVGLWAEAACERATQTVCAACVSVSESVRQS